MYILSKQLHLIWPNSENDLAFSDCQNRPSKTNEKEKCKGPELWSVRIQSFPPSQPINGNKEHRREEINTWEHLALGICLWKMSPHSTGLWKSVELDTRETWWAVENQGAVSITLRPNREAAVWNEIIFQKCARVLGSDRTLPRGGKAGRHDSSNPSPA